MFSKRVKIIILVIIVLFFLSILIFVLKGGAPQSRPIESIHPTNPPTPTESSDLDKNFEELKNNHPELSSEQLEFYLKAAVGKEKCEGRDDENNCIASAAFIRGKIGYCDEIENQEERIKCANSIAEKRKIVEKCWARQGDDFINCSIAIFGMYGKSENCLNLNSEEMRQLCESVFAYETAFNQYDRELCGKIKNEKLNQYCLKNIIDKFQDSDGDGLTDLDEINKYKTHYRFSDTDGDGVSDGEEVKNGTNPLDGNSRQ